MPFLLGSTGQIMLNILRRKPLDFKCLAPGLFLGSFTGLLKTTNCIIRRFFSPHKAAEMAWVPGLIAGFVSSFFYPSKSLSIYILWKTLEVVCKIGVSKEVLPTIPWAKEVIYASATSILFHLAVVKPHKLKPSYFKFMNKITGNRYPYKICAKF